MTFQDASGHTLGNLVLSRNGPLSSWPFYTAGLAWNTLCFTFDLCAQVPCLLLGHLLCEGRRHTLHEPGREAGASYTQKRLNSSLSNEGIKKITLCPDVLVPQLSEMPLIIPTEM